MHTIQLKINEIEIISDDVEFKATKAYLQKEYDEIVAGTAVFVSQKVFEQEIDELIAKYETVN